MTASSLTTAQLNGILSIADDAIICVDAAHNVILFNRGAERIFGWKASEIIGQSLNLLLPPRFRSDHDKHIERFDSSGSDSRQMAERSAIYGIRRDGTEFPAEASISRLDVGESMIHTVILRDITQRKQYEQELRAAKEAAETAMRAKSMFLANMSHEIRTPLNAVIGMTSLLLNTRIDDEQRDYAETIRASSEALLTTINDILDYAKIEAGRLEIERQPYDLRRCIEESLDLLSSAAGAKNIRLAYFIDDSVPALLVGDMMRVRQILANLLSNSIKFTHHGEVVVSVSAASLGEGRHEVNFSVRDTGIGIPADKQSEIFHSFTQVDASITRKYGGTGLGLAISRRLAEIMGGRMWVESEAGVGSTFFFTIVAEAASRPAVPQRLGEMLPLTILVAEDNTVNQKVVAQFLAHLGYRADMVANGLEVLDAMERHPYDVVLMDVQMPEMDGYEATRRLRERYGAGPRVIAMTANAMPGDRNKCLAAGMDAYVSKPVELDDIRSVLMEVAGSVEPAAAEQREPEGEPVIDRRRIDHLLELQDENSPTLVADLITLFFNDSPRHFDNIAQAVNAGNAQLLEISAHRFLSSIENLGAMRMRRHCMELEALGRSGKMIGAAAAFEALQHEFDIARQHLSAINGN